MKKRVAILLILAFCGIMAAVALAQSKVVPFKQLQQLDRKSVV